jgi:LmbE family N-acetylglucosaminyl deacetylase
MPISRPDSQSAWAFLAHPNAENHCANTFIRRAKAGWEARIVTATAGDFGAAILPALENANFRRSAAIAAAKRIGATYHINVFFDKPIAAISPPRRCFWTAVDRQTHSCSAPVVMPTPKPTA